MPENAADFYSQINFRAPVNERVEISELSDSYGSTVKPSGRLGHERQSSSNIDEYNLRRADNR